MTKMLHRGIQRLFLCPFLSAKRMCGASWSVRGGYLCVEGARGRQSAFLLGFTAIVRCGDVAAVKNVISDISFPVAWWCSEGIKMVFEGALNGVQGYVKDHFPEVTKMIVKVLKFGFRWTLRWTFRWTKNACEKRNVSIRWTLRWTVLTLQNGD